MKMISEKLFETIMGGNQGLFWPIIDVTCFDANGYILALSCAHLCQF
jgi:hypothetical protein